MPALSLPTVPFENPPTRLLLLLFFLQNHQPPSFLFPKPTRLLLLLFFLQNHQPPSFLFPKSTKKKSGRRIKLKRSSIGSCKLQLSAEEKPESLLTKKGIQAAKAEEHLINPILLPLLESLGVCTETGDSAHPLHAPTELQLLVQDVEAGPRSPLVASSSNPGGREFSASAVNSGVPLFEEDISDYMRRVEDDLEFEQEHQAAPAVCDEEPATALSDTQAGAIPRLPNTSNEVQTPASGTVSPGRSNNSSKEDLLAALRIDRRARFGRVRLTKGESAQVLNDILAAVPSLKGRSRVGLLTRLRAMHKSVPLEVTPEGSFVKSELPQSPVALLPKKQRAGKERKVRRVTEARPDLTTREPEMDCSDSGRDAACACFTTAAMATPNEQSPSAGEGQPDRVSPKLTVSRGSQKGSQLSFEESELREPEPSKNSHSTARGEPNGGRNPEAGQFSSCLSGTQTPTKRAKFCNTLHAELISKLDVGARGSRLSQIEPTVLQRLVRDKEVIPVFDHTLALVRSKPTSEWLRTSRHMYVEVRWDLVNKLNYLATPHFASASSLEDVTAVVVACQQTYDAFIKTSKALNKAASLQRSAATNLSKLLESTQGQLNIVNASIRKDAVDKASNKALKHLWAKFNEGKQKENLSLNDRKFLSHKLEELLRSLERQVKNLEGKKAFWFENRKFELNRAAFYRETLSTNNSANTPTVGTEEIVEFWKGMYSSTEGQQDYSETIRETFTHSNDESELTVSLAEVQAAVRGTRSWSACGRDTVYNFWLKYLPASHLHLAQLYSAVLRNPEQLSECTLQLRTLLIPKVAQPKAGEYRPITIMSNVLKLLSKIVLGKVKPALVESRVISENRGAFGDNTVGAKELVLLDEAIQGQYKGKLASAWLDVKKVFDSVPRAYMLAILKKLPINAAVPKLIERIYRSPSTRLELLVEKDITQLGSIPLQKGVFQEDSLSPLLFVLAMQLLTKLLHSTVDTLAIGDSNHSMALNHLLFMEDLKLFLHDTNSLGKLLSKTKEFFAEVGLNLNAQKSARSSDYTEVKNLNELPVVNSATGYKYLGFFQTDKTLQMANKKKLIELVHERVVRMIGTNLSGRNMVTALNEVAVSLLNYSAGVTAWTETELTELDQMIVKLLKEKELLHRFCNKSRLYRSRKASGLGLQSMLFGNRKQVSKLHARLAVMTSNKRAVILKLGEQLKTPLFKRITVIKRMLGDQTRYETAVDLQALEAFNARKDNEEVQSKVLYRVHMNNFALEAVDQETSSSWLRKVDASPKVVGNLMALQDRTLYQNLIKTKLSCCPACKKARTSVDHLQTLCPALLAVKYKQRHDAICRLVHFNLVVKYGLAQSRCLANHKPTLFMENERAKLLYEVSHHNMTGEKSKPDIILHNKLEGYIQLIEVGITCPKNLVQREYQKKCKYFRFATDIYNETGIKTQAVPVVMTWSGLVTKHFKQYMRTLGLVGTIPLMLKSVLKQGFDVSKVILKP